MENFIDWQSRSDAELNQYIDYQGSIMRSGIRAQSCPSGRIINATMVIRRETFERLNGFNEWFSGCDMEFAERAHRAKVPVFISPAVVALRRLHAHSITRGQDYGSSSAYFRRVLAERSEIFRQFNSSADYHQFGCLNKRHLLKVSSSYLPEQISK